MIQDKSMLIELTISKWAAIKHDKSVSAEVETTHAAKDAGRYNKRLIDKKHLAALETHASNVRKYHYSRTLPWTDKGQRLLPSALFMDYRADISKFKDQYAKLVDDFVTEYPSLVQDARGRLNTMFQPDDYPQAEDIHKLFGINLEIMPVPDAADFRVDVAAETQDEIRVQITGAIAVRQQRAVKDCWERIRVVMTRMAEQCEKDKPIIHESLVENIEELAAVLDGLNIMNDPDLAAVTVDLQTQFDYTGDDLRNYKSNRVKALAAAQAILARIP